MASKLSSRRTGFVGHIGDIHDSALNPVGLRVWGVDDNGSDAEYIYLKGVANVALGSWVTYNYLFASALITHLAVGMVAIAQAAVVANKYGFFRIYGYDANAKSDTTAANKALYIDGTDGRVDDAVVTGDLVVNAMSAAADTANVLPVFIQYPFVTAVLG